MLLFIWLGNQGDGCASGEIVSAHWPAVLKGRASLCQLDRLSVFGT